MRSGCPEQAQQQQRQPPRRSAAHCLNCPPSSSLIPLPHPCSHTKIAAFRETTQPAVINLQVSGSGGSGEMSALLKTVPQPALNGAFVGKV